MTEAAPAIIWFRQDLRLADNPALNAATEGGRPVIPVFVLDDHTPGRWAFGAVARLGLPDARLASRKLHLQRVLVERHRDRVVAAKDDI